MPPSVWRLPPSRSKGRANLQADGYAGERYIAAVAGRVTADGKIDGDSLVDLAPHIRDGKLSWQVPAGKWKIMKFTPRRGAPSLPGQWRGKQLSVDGASKDCVDWFLQTVYQPHYDHFKADFGKTIRGFFYDEPETPGDWGTELNRVLAEWKVDWKKAYVAYKFELAGEEQTAAKYQYLDAFAETWGRTMYGGMADWCHAARREVHRPFHGARRPATINREFCAGDMMRLQGHSDMGAHRRRLQAVCHGAAEAASTRGADRRPRLANAQARQFDLPRLRQAGRRGHGRDLRRARTRPHLSGNEVVGRPHAGLGRQLPDPAFVQSAVALRHGLPALFLQRRLRAALAAVSRLRRLHQPAEPDAHRRAARLPGGAAVRRQHLPGGQGRSCPRT